MNADGLAFLERLDNCDAETRKARWQVVNRCAAYAETDTLVEYLMFAEQVKQSKNANDFGVSLILHLLLRSVMNGGR